MRKMNRALNVLKDHVAAVMDVEFSPTGEELVVCVISESFIPLLTTLMHSLPGFYSR
jgi:WD repeat and SOF domain-containing protein 1